MLPENRLWQQHAHTQTHTHTRLVFHWHNNLCSKLTLKPNTNLNVSKEKERIQMSTQDQNCQTFLSIREHLVLIRIKIHGTHTHTVVSQKLQVCVSDNTWGYFRSNSWNLLTRSLFCAKTLTWIFILQILIRRGQHTAKTKPWSKEGHVCYELKPKNAVCFCCCSHTVIQSQQQKKNPQKDPTLFVQHT